MPGASLRCVVIDKLPFASPSDPVTSARIRALSAIVVLPYLAVLALFPFGRRVVERA